MKKNEMLIVTVDGTEVKVSTELYNHIITNLRNGIKIGEAEIVKVDNRSKTTTTTTKTTTAKSNSKPKAKKAKDDFDYDKYISIAKKIGCYGNKGVWKCGRSTVYKVMNGELTQTQAKAEIKAIVAKNGWGK